MDRTLWYPVQVTVAEEGTTTLAENIAPLSMERYRMEKYLITSPADVDVDCIDDITELNDLGAKNPVNPAVTFNSNDGAVAIPDRETFEDLAFRYASGKTRVKFSIFDMDSNRPSIYFQNTAKFNHHSGFLSAIGIDRIPDTSGTVVYDPFLVAPDDSPGVYRYVITFGGESFAYHERIYTLIASSMPVVDDKLAFWISNAMLPGVRGELSTYRASRMNILFDEDVYPATNFTALNQAEGYGVLRHLESDERPHPRDVVIYEALPNELPRVAGIISTVPQTPLSHVNLRALQDDIPNAFIADALEDDAITDLIGSHVHYAVTDAGYTIRAATRAEVDAHHDYSRPAETQTPQRDLSVTTIISLSEIGFDDWDSFGVKTANVAVLGTLGFPDRTVPDGFAVPLYFYDAFMKHNDFYDDIEEMLADADFQTDYDTMASELKKLRKKIKKAETPDWIETALTTMHATYPDGQSLRYRSSTNNEDLPGFNGAGLYDSKTQHPGETEEDGISKSLKQVYAGLWNFRAFIGREFHRIDHLTTAMGVLVHPNYSDERVNGVAISVDPAFGTPRSYYVNAQVGEDLVTNPEVNSVPEELLLHSDGTYAVVALSNQVSQGDLLMTNDQLGQLRQRLATIDEKFEELYGIEKGQRFAMEIEFKITSDDVLAIKQARPWVFPPLTERFDLEPTAHGGKPFKLRVRFSAPTTILRTNLRDRAVSVTDGSVTGARKTTYSSISEWWEVEITPNSIGDVTIVVAPHLPCNNVAAICTSDGERLSNRLELTVKGHFNNPATGVSVISGTPQVGRTLTADTSGIDDADGLNDVPYSYRWMRNDGTTDTDIPGATGSTHVLVSDDEGKTIKVRVSFTDDLGNAESLTSAATDAVAPAPDPLTAQFLDTPSSHDGQTAFTFELRFSEEFLLSYKTLRDHAFTVTGGEVTKARRLEKPGNVRWEIHLSPDGDGDVTVLLPVTTDCAASGAICTEDERKLSAEVTRTVAGPERAENSPATGAPTIHGTVRVGMTLTAYGNRINDADGLTNVSYSYQWVSNDGNADTDIDGATGSTYELSDSDVGKAIKVRVSFTDDEGNGESLTTAATSQVKDRLNRPATGLPTIIGTVQVGETLTADTSRIADEDGLANVTFKYEWLADDAVIAGANDSSYILPDSDRERAVRVRVSFTDDRGFDESLTSNPVGVADRPYELTASVLDGGVVLTWKRPAGFVYLHDYQILRNRPELGEAEPIVYVDTGTSETTHTDTDVEPGVLYVYRVKAANFFARLSKASDPVEIRTTASTPVENSPATGQPTISGTLQVGETLTADTGGIEDADGLNKVSYSYQWLAGDMEIAGVTSASYTLGASDLNKSIKVRVDFTDDAGHQESLTSQPVGPVDHQSSQQRINSPPTGAPVISGTLQVGETLTTDTTGIVDDDGLTNASFSYQWLADSADITGTTGSSHTLTNSEEGRAIKVRVSFTDDAGSGESLTSAATDAVAPSGPTEPPPAPTNLTSTLNADGSITLTWNAPNDDSVTGYQILRRRPREGEDTLLVYVENTASTETTSTDTDVEAGQLYVYRVKARNKRGLSERSNYANVET